ncbi:MAG: ATP-binding protein [Pirellulaceae bacterium]|nr:PAS domain S-box protein [Planctomycetales bacterium]
MTLSASTPEPDPNAETQDQLLDLTSRDALWSVLDAAPTAIVVIDDGGTIVHANAMTYQLFGYDAASLIGRSVELLMPPRFRETHAVLRQDYLLAPSTRRMGDGRDLTGLHRDGYEFAVEVGISHVQSQGRSFTVAGIVDITERKKSELHLRRMNEALEKSNLELQQYAFIASHDLQSPIRSISSFSQFLLLDYESQLDDKGKDFLRRIINSTEHMKSLVTSLLNYSRVDSRAMAFEEVPLDRALKDALDMLESSIVDSHAICTHDPLPSVMGDYPQMVQLFQNLIGNAIKYHDRTPPHIHVSSHPHDDVWVVAVRDNGIGIDARAHHRIFDIFHRLHGQNAYPGTGIGLAICRRIIERHGGTIWVESEVHKGSTFYFSIPKLKTKGQTDAQCT